MEEKIYTLRYVLMGLYENDEEIEKFLKIFHFSLNFIPNFSVLQLLFKRERYKSLQFKYHLKYIFTVRDKFCEFKGIKENDGSPLFLIRVDDFPHWENTLNDFQRFHKIMEEFETPYLLGVTPNLSLNRHNPYNTNFKKINSRETEVINHPLIEIAMHGFSHQSHTRKKYREFSGIKREDAIKKIENGLNILKEFGIKPAAFIPPFDRIDKISYSTLAKYFKIITGGPDSCKTLGYKVSPSFFKGAIYVPSYRPMCNRCYKIIHFFKQHKVKRKIIIPVTIHWTHELKKDNYTSLKELLKITKGKVLNWKELQKFILSSSPQI